MIPNNNNDNSKPHVYYRAPGTVLELSMNKPASSSGSSSEVVSFPSLTRKDTMDSTSKAMLEDGVVSGGIWESSVLGCLFICLS